MLATSIRMAAPDLVSLQRAGEHHLGLSLTKACPLSCGHCSAATVPAAMHPFVSIPAAEIARYCAEMPELARRGLTSISLTGGEPVLALQHVAALSRAARDAGIRTTLVTGLYWAAGAGLRRKVIEALPCIDSWNISWDRFHAAEVKLANVAIAVREIAATGAALTVRVAIDDPAPPEDEAMYDALVAALPDVEIVVQPVRPVGRAADRQATASGNRAAPAWPCLSTGPLVMPDGSARPCCSSMMDEPHHPFDASSAAHGLVALREAWLDDPLLLMLRAVGFAPVLGILGDIAPDHPLTHGTTAHPCDVCSTLFGDRALAGRIKAVVAAEPVAGLARAAARDVFASAAIQTRAVIREQEQADA